MVTTEDVNKIKKEIAKEKSQLIMVKKIAIEQRNFEKLLAEKKKLRAEIKAIKPKGKFQKLTKGFNETLHDATTKKKVDKGLKKLDKFLDKFGFD